jgi:hypothetical protein
MAAPLAVWALELCAVTSMEYASNNKIILFFQGVILLNINWIAIKVN